MALVCPRCLRQLADSADPADRPVFCMYCGQRLRADTTPVPPPAVMPDPAQTVDAPTQSLSADPTPEAEAGRPAASDPPTELGGYRLGKFIGAGGMGVVYEAEAVATGQRVAVKVLSGRLAQNPTSVERFRQEGRVASQITHPHCVFVFRADADVGRPYIVMELMPGRTLKDLVDQGGPLRVAEAVRRILDVVAGLGEAHRLGVIHRDVKPSNCFLTDDDRVKVGDFGLSKSLAADRGERQITQSGAFLGTVLFASPEQIRGEPVGYESDVYGVCGTLYYLLTGRAPYQHESLTAALARAVSEPPPPIRARRPDVPVELERVILRGLERDRDRRWQSLEELGDALREMLPDAQRPARPRSLILAYLVDTILLQFVIVPVELLRQWAVGLRNIQVALFESTLTGLAVTVAYFAIFEGLLGWTPGKRLLRMRVSRVGETGPPGLRAALVRAAVFNGMWVMVAYLPDWLLEWSGGPLVLLLALTGAAVGVGLLLYQLWPKEGWYLGVHDYASGCRVVQRRRLVHRVRLVSRFPNPLDRPQPSTDRLPASVGGFAVKGKVADLPDGGEVWSAEDKGLGRRVLVRIFPPNTDDPLGADDPATRPTHLLSALARLDRLVRGLREDSITRPTRLRAIGHGTLVWRGTERGWVGYVAPEGAPLADVVDPAKPLTWADARPLLEQVAAELAAAEGDGSGVETPSVAQVWVEPGGRLQLLDFPLPLGRGEEEKRRGGEEERKTGEGSVSSSPPLLLSSSSDALRFVRRVASLALEGQPRAGGGRLRAPLPPHASRITDRLFEGGYRTLNQLRADLEESHAHPAAVTAGVRAAHLSAQAGMLAFGLVFMFGVAGLFSFFVAVMGVYQARGLEEIRDMVRDPAARELMLARVRELPDDRAEARARMERELSPAGAPETVRRLDELVDHHRAELDRARDRLTRPERALLTRFERVPTDKPRAEDFSATEVEMILLAARQQRPPRPEVERWGYFILLLVLFVAPWPLIWAACAFAFRGGLALSLAGITPVRPDGRKAGRFRCAARELLVWLPIAVLLFASMWLQAAFPGQVALRTAVWLVAVLLLPVYVVVALRDRARTPADRVMGTYLVPV